jgi:hypothetical protein
MKAPASENTLNRVSRLAAEESSDLPERTPREIREDFVSAVHDFTRVQEAHDRAVEQGKLKDVFTWRGQRQEMFSRLVQSLEEIRNFGPGLEKEFVVEAQGIIARLLQGEKELKGAVARQQSLMGSQLDELRKGKKALKGYSVYNGQVPRPQYLSNRM